MLNMLPEVTERASSCSCTGYQGFRRAFGEPSDHPSIFQDALKCMPAAHLFFFLVLCFYSPVITTKNCGFKDLITVAKQDKYINRLDPIY